MTIFTFIAFVSYFAVVFLGLKVDSKIISLRRDVHTLKTQQKELKEIVRTLYKLIFINYKSILISNDSIKFKKLHVKLTSLLAEYFEKDDLTKFLNEIKKLSENNP